MRRLDNTGPAAFTAHETEIVSFLLLHYLDHIHVPIKRIRSLCQLRQYVPTDGTFATCCFEAEGTAETAERV